MRLKSEKEMQDYSSKEQESSRKFWINKFQEFSIKII